MSEQLSLLGGGDDLVAYRLDQVANPAAVTSYSLFFCDIPGGR
jgi:hypothetical protein